jgi:NADH-quinone oxidoreductase subunit N
LLALALVVSFLSFIGIPPLAGFAGKLALFGVAIDAGYAWLAVLAAINTVVSVAYYVRVLAPAYFDASAEPLPLLGKWAAVGTAMSAAALVGFGITAEPLMRAFAGARLLP